MIWKFQSFCLLFAFRLPLNINSVNLKSINPYFYVDDSDNTDNSVNSYNFDDPYNTDDPEDSDNSDDPEDSDDSCDSVIRIQPFYS